MTRTMYDSVTAADIPTSAQMVGGYVDGLYRWSQADWDRFPNAVQVRISVNPANNDGHVQDIETGNGTPADAVGWVNMRRGSGVDPSVYMSAGDWNAVIQAFRDRGVPLPHFWVAQWDGVQSIPSGSVAKQYAGSATSGGHFDLSVVADFWPGVDVGTTGPVGPLPPGQAPLLEAAGSVRYVTWNAAQQFFRVKSDGILVQAVNDGRGNWAQFELGSGYVPGALEMADISGVQLHVWALKPDGGVMHMWQDAGTAFWNREAIPSA